MAFAQAQSRQRNIAEINITPLIDVMLVLLVIFMIAAPILSRPIPLTLPQAVPPDPNLQRLPPLELRIDAAGQLVLGGQAMPMSALSSILSAERVRAGNEPLILQIKANDQVDYQTVARVLATAKNAGLEHIRIL
jgi:biopolymer transport protein ExbD